MRTHTIQDATGDVVRYAPDGRMYTVQRIAPTDGQPGFAVGCFWINAAGSPAGIFYVNIGSKTSSNWLNIC